jgi:hypothetical protein
MDNLSPQWRNFLKNLFWFMATIVILILSIQFLRFRYGLLLLWLIGLGWAGVLAFQFSQLLFGSDETSANEEKLQVYLDQAASYKTKIDRTVESASTQADRIRLEQLAGQIDTWTDAITKLAQRVSILRQDELVRRDMQQVPRAIADLEKRLTDETDPDLKAQLERTLTNRQKQLEALEQLDNTMERAEMQIESTVSMLGTIYSQILTGQSTSHVADYSRLSSDVDEEVRVLQDHLEALREVKLDGD